MANELIRRARESDADELTRLTSELGYPCSVATMRSRLAKILHSPGDCILVAEARTGELLGWIHGFLSQRLEAEFRAEIGGLVVDSRHRRRGTGTHLVRAIEDWAAALGALELAVRCREERAEAHSLYEGLSFHHAKSQRVFRRRTEKRAGHLSSPSGP